MMTRNYRAAVSKKLVVILTLTAIAAVGIWIVRLNRSDGVVEGGAMTIYCPTCGKQETNEKKWQGNKFLCPECNEYSASFTDPSQAPAGGLGESP